MGITPPRALAGLIAILFVLAACQGVQSQPQTPVADQTPGLTPQATAPAQVASTPAPAPAPTATTAPAPTATQVPPAATPSGMAALLPCGAPSLVSTREAPTPSTPVASPTQTQAPAAASPTPRPPTPTPRPAPQQDRIGFPEGYRDTFKQLYVFDRLDARSVSYVCGNEAVASVKPGEPFPNGSILVFESWRPKQDASGNTIKDANGHLIRETLNALFVMRKEQGFGEAYGNLRTSEWEYVAYRPDKSFQTPPQNTAVCAACHQAAGKDRDWVFRGELFFAPDRYAQSPLPGPNEATMSRMAFFPATLAVKAGTTVTWTNSAVDKIDHTVTASDNSFDSGVLKPGASFSQTFNTPGTFQYTCTLHPEQMRARVLVTQ